MKSNLFNLGIFTLACSWLATHPAGADDGTLIEPTWKVGKKYSCEHSQHVVITIGEGEQAINNPVHVEINFEVEVSSHGTQGEKALSFEATKAKMTMNIFDQISAFDSEDPENQSPNVASMLQGVLKTEDLKLIYDKDDKFVKFEEGKKDQKKAAPASAPVAAVAPMQFGKNEIRQLLGYCVRSFPDKPVNKGDKWENEESVNFNLGAADVKIEMTAKGPNDKGKPIVDYQSKIDVKFPEGGAAGGGAGKGEMKGEMTYDPEKAIIENHTAEIDMTANVAGLQLPVRQTAKTTVVNIEDIKK
jgi:hypothetical protein